MCSSGVEWVKTLHSLPFQKQCRSMKYLIRKVRVSLPSCPFIFISKDPVCELISRLLVRKAGKKQSVNFKCCIISVQDDPSCPLLKDAVTLL